MISSLYTPKPKKPVSLTALIDVVFILLLFFMLSSSFSRWQGVDLMSPLANEKVSGGKPNLIRLFKTGVMSIYSKPDISLTETNISSMIDETKPSILLPDSDVDVQLIVSTLEQLSNLDVQNLSLGSSLPAAAKQP
ncbi:MAG: biopolymer transporter ExbD [Porticoccus sp.]|nr:biopolymer transporter ExbD [Porticoccus sp.]